MSHATRGLVTAPNLDFADAAKLHLLLDRRTHEPS